MAHSIRIDPFFDEDGKITKLPKKQAVRLVVLAQVTAQFEPGRVYTETEINGICASCQTFGDVFLLRRELVDHGFLLRKPDGSAYWRNPRAPAQTDDPAVSAAPAETGAPADAVAPREP